MLYSLFDLSTRMRKRSVYNFFDLWYNRSTETGGMHVNNFFLDRLKGVSLTKSQERIAQYMLENQYTVCQKSLMEVSREAGVSDASVLRFVRAIGFSGYNDFKDTLYTHLAQQASENADRGAMDLGSRLRSGTPQEGNSLQEYLKISLSNVERSLLQTPCSTYEHIVSLLGGCRNLYIFGNRAARASADQLARSIRYIKDNVIFLQHTYDLYPALHGAGPEDVLLFLCVSRFYKADVQICQAAKAAGVRLCLLTNTAPSPVTKYADDLLLAYTDGISYFNSTLGISAVCEYLVARLAQATEGTAQRLSDIDAYSADERYPHRGE